MHGDEQALLREIRYDLLTASAGVTAGGCRTALFYEVCAVAPYGDNAPGTILMKSPAKRSVVPGL
jgi:hypothetical protein